MTEIERKALALVERLREVSSVLFDDYRDGTYAVEDYALATKAADRIEALEAENERLREEVQSLTDELGYHGIYPRPLLDEDQ